MLPDRVSNPGPLTYESGALPIALRGPALKLGTNKNKYLRSFDAISYVLQKQLPTNSICLKQLSLVYKMKPFTRTLRKVTIRSVFQSVLANGFII